MTNQLKGEFRRMIPARIRAPLRRGRDRTRVVVHYRGLRRAPLTALRYLAFGRERDNFTYDIANKDELSSFIAGVYGESPARVSGLMDELDEDVELARLITGKLRHRPDREPRMPFGRRLGWYAIVRIIRPELIVETGVHDGLGSVALLRALARNADEGHDGSLIGLDIHPSAGWLVPETLRSRYDLVIEDSLQALPRVLERREVGLFVHDSDHRYEHEMGEYGAAEPHLGSTATLISDNAHASRAFFDYCDRIGAASWFWREVPIHHFYPGAGIGVGLMRVGSST